MPKNMGKPEFSGKISKDLTTFMRFEIKYFGKVLKISGHIMEKFQLFMELNFCRKLYCQQIQENEILPLYWHSLLCKLKEIIKEFLLQS